MRYTWVVELISVNPATLATTNWLFARGQGVSFDTGYVPGGLKKWSAPTQKIDISTQGMVSSQGVQGSLVIDNLPDSFGGAGILDDALDHGWQGQQAFLYVIPEGAPWASRVLMDHALLEQPVGTMVANEQIKGELTFPLRDYRSHLDRPFFTTKFKGNNPPDGSGVEGTPGDIMGKGKPICYGAVSNIPGVRVSQQYNFFMIADKVALPTDVRDGGVSLTAGAAYSGFAQFSTFFTAPPAAGAYSSFSDPVIGSFVRLGSNLTRKLGIDCVEGSSPADRSHAQIWKRIREQRVFTYPLNAASITATQALDPAEAGFWWDGSTDISQRDALDEVLRSFSGYEVMGIDYEMRLAKLNLPPAPGMVDLEMVQPGSVLTNASRELISVERVRPDWTENGAPPFRVSLNWGRNYQEMVESDFAGAASQYLRDKFGQKYRTVSFDNLATWNPSTQVGPFPNAPEMSIDSGYADTTDGGSGAGGECFRVRDLFSVLRSQYQVSFRPKIYPVPDRILPGNVVKMTMPFGGLSGGAYFLVLQSGFTLDENGDRMNLVLGLES